MALAHLHEMVAAVDVPINADFESGFASDAAGVAKSVGLAVQTGIAGLSIELRSNAGSRLLGDTVIAGRLMQSNKAPDPLCSPQFPSVSPAPETRYVHASARSMRP